MQDLATYQSDPAVADPGTTAPAAAQPRTKTMLRSKSEGYSKGETTNDSAGYLRRGNEAHDIIPLQWRFCIGYQVCRNGLLFIF